MRVTRPEFAWRVAKKRGLQPCAHLYVRHAPLNVPQRSRCGYGRRGIVRPATDADIRCEFCLRLERQRT